MNSVFLRVFSGVTGALVLFSIVAVGLFYSLNSVRFLQYQEQRVKPLFDWVSVNPEQHLAFLEAISPPDTFIEAVAKTDLPLSRLQRERLGYGQTLVKRHQSGLHAFTTLDRENILVAYFSDLPLGTTLWAGQLIAMQIRALPNDARIQRLDRLAEQFDLTSHIAPMTELAAWQGSKQKLFLENGWVLLPSFPGQGAVLAIALDTEYFVKFDPLPTFDPWAWPIILTLVLVGAVCVGGTLFLLLENLERRLRKLESVTSRISRGELDARVDDNRFDSVGRLAMVFNQMADHIQRLVAVQREMIHAVSHELRTPVARIRFGVQMIEDSVEDPLQIKQLQGIDHDIQELNELIDEILTYARLEQGGPILDFQETNLIDIVDQVVEEQQSVKPEMRITSVFSPDAERWKMSEVEPRYIHRSIQNLVGNATRYAKSIVTVKATFGADTCRIDVEDDGPGIPESDWEKVFTAFARLDDSRTRSSGGYGLGLSIVRRILYWHGGQAFVARSEELGGAKFSLVWPRRQD